jgi:hypothetical protein
MNLIKKINYDDEGVYDVAYFNNGRELSFEDYIRIENALELEDDIDFEDDYEDELAEYNYDEDELDFGNAILDAINDTFEMFENPTTCDDCKKKALINLVLLGVDGAMQGCIVRE